MRTPFQISSTIQTSTLSWGGRIRFWRPTSRNLLRVSPQPLRCTTRSRGILQPLQQQQQLPPLLRSPVRPLSPGGRPIKFQRIRQSNNNFPSTLFLLRHGRGDLMDMSLFLLGYRWFSGPRDPPLLLLLRMCHLALLRFRNPPQRRKRLLRSPPGCAPFRPQQRLPSNRASTNFPVPVS